MTRKDYQATAEVIKGILKDYSDSCGENTTRELCMAMCEGMSALFKRDNAGFKPDKFREACGL